MSPFLVSLRGRSRLNTAHQLLAVHTFVSVVLQIGVKARGIAFTLVCLAFVFITLWVAIGAGIHKNYETPTPVRALHLFLLSFPHCSHYSGQYWCWISPQFPRDRLGGETVWMWIALFASAILYVPLHFWAEGFWSFDEGFRFHWRSPDHRVEYASRRSTLRLLL